MNKKLSTKISIFLLALGAVFTSCQDDNDGISLRPTALVTVKPTADSFYLQLDDSTRLVPANMTKSPFGDKEVRALVNYKIEDKDNKYSSAHISCIDQSVHINWIDSIRTKMAVPSLGSDIDILTYGNDPVEIVNDWVTVAEDGYLTLRTRTLWGYPGNVHYLNLVTGVNPENPFELELRHDARGDVGVSWGDALIAFNLRDVLKNATSDKVKFTLRWNSFSGTKKIEFGMKSKPMDTRCNLDETTEFNQNVK